MRLILNNVKLFLVANAMDVIILGKRSKQKQKKETKHKLEQQLKKQQYINRQRLVNGKTLELSIKARPPKASQYNSLLESIDLSINNLRDLNLKDTSDDNILAAVNKIISYKTNSVVSMILMESTFRKINNGFLYRVRPCYEDCLGIMKVESDAWNPPPEYVKSKGRLNSENESLLYVAENMETAIKEMKIEEDNCFWLIVYDIKSEIGLVNIGDTPTEHNEFYPAYKKVANFLRKEFTREVKSGEEHEYRVSRLISRFHYPLLNNFNGWSYPSVASYNQSSLCLHPENAKQKMELAFVIHAKILNGEIRCNSIAFLNGEGTFEYHTLEEAVKRDERLQSIIR